MKKIIIVLLLLLLISSCVASSTPQEAKVPNLETITLIIWCLLVGWVIGAKQIHDYHKNKVRKGMKPRIGKTGDLEWSD